MTGSLPRSGSSAASSAACRSVSTPRLRTPKAAVNAGEGTGLHSRRPGDRPPQPYAFGSVVEVAAVTPARGVDGHVVGRAQPQRAATVGEHRGLAGVLPEQLGRGVLAGAVAVDPHRLVRREH